MTKLQTGKYEFWLFFYAQFGIIYMLCFISLIPGIWQMPLFRAT